MSAHVETQLKKAQKALSGRRFAEARDGFRQVLETFPANARAKRGYWVSQSALADAGFAANHPPRQQLDAIASALSGGKADDAAAAAGALTGRFPRAHGLYNLLGVALATLGREDEAIAAFQASVRLKPDFLEARVNLAGRLVNRHALDAALALLTDSLDMAPEDIGSLNAMTVCLIRLRRFDDALAVAGRAVRAKPGNAEAHNNLGVCQRHLGRFEEAAESYRRALELSPGFFDAMLNLGVSLVRTGRAEEATGLYRQCLAARPGDAGAHNNMGLALVEMRRFDDAVAQFDAALVSSPDLIDADFNRFTALALAGRLDQAWVHAECRFDARRSVPVEYRYRGTAPAWDGRQSLAGRTLLVHAEQGLGDTLIFIRYLAHLPADASKVVLAVQNPLHRLLSAQTGFLDGIEMLSLKDEEGFGDTPHDLQCPLMSLPLLLGDPVSGHPVSEDPATMAAQPYLSVPEPALSEWRRRLGASGQRRVGFVFRGNPDHVNDINRSMELGLFLSALPPGPDYHFLGLDLRPAEKKLLSRRGDIRTHHEDISDFCDTAALVSLMDRVVAVDTSVAHLAGALGVDTHILLAHTPDWRWGLEAERTFWYPSVTLHRQTARADWQAVLKAVCKDLVRFAKVSNAK